MGLPVRTAEKRPGVVPGGSFWGGTYGSPMECLGPGIYPLIKTLKRP